MSARLVEQAHVIVRGALRAGDVAIDATAGGGRDTLALAQAVGARGRVYALDVQVEALAATQELLHRHAVTNVTLCKQCHSSLTSAIPADERETVGAVMFNLGYLPGGDPSVATRVPSTMPALEAALGLLRVGGVLTVIAYTGHPGGRQEAVAARRVLDAAPRGAYERLDDPREPIRPPAPRLLAVRRLG